MAEHDLHAAAFPKLDEAQIVAPGYCAGALHKRYQEGAKAH